MNWERIETARNWARSLFVVAGLAIMFVIFSIISTPVGPTPLIDHGPRVAGIAASTVLTGIGIGGVLFGLAWMWRIYRAPTRYEGAHWRFHDRDRD